MDHAGASFTNVDGQVNFMIQPGSYQVFASKEGFLAVDSFVTIGEEDNDPQLLIVLAGKKYYADYSVEPKDAGTVEGAGEYFHGQDISLQAIPAEGYSFLYWEENGFFYPGEQRIINGISSNHFLRARFKRIYYSILTSVTGQGQIILSEGSISPSGRILAEHGSTINLDFLPAEGYYIEDVFVNGKSIGPVESYTIDYADADKSIDVVFKIYTYNIQLMAGENGSIIPHNASTPADGIFIIEHGKHQSFYIIPDPGYKILRVLVDSEDVGTPAAYTFQNVTDHHVLEALFEKKDPTVINQPGISTSLKIYPNPTRNHVNIETERIMIDLKVFDIYGKLVMSSRPGQQKTQLNLEGLTNGKYIIQVILDNDSTLRDIILIIK
jgi:hypothetical protein